MGSGGAFDYKEVIKLQKQLEHMQREKDIFYRECAQELAARLLAKVKKRTPVGMPPKLDNTKSVKVKGASGKSSQGGTLRNGWTIGTVTKKGDSYEIEVVNPTEYASYVEYGHRQSPGRYVPALGKKLKAGWVKGQFMMTISEKEIQAISPKLLEKKLEAFLKGGLDV